MLHQAGGQRTGGSHLSRPNALPCTLCRLGQLSHAKSLRSVLLWSVGKSDGREGLRKYLADASDLGSLHKGGGGTGSLQLSSDRSIGSLSHSQCGTAQSSISLSVPVSCCASVSSLQKSPAARHPHSVVCPSLESLSERGRWLQL